MGAVKMELVKPVLSVIMELICLVLIGVPQTVWILCATRRVELVSAAETDGQVQSVIRVFFIIMFIV